MHHGSFQILFVLVYACTGFGVFIYAAVRWHAKASSTWDTLAHGVVADVSLCEVVSPVATAESSTMPLRSFETVITFWYGKRVLLFGDHANDCKAGDAVLVKRNKLGDYRIEHING